MRTLLRRAILAAVPAIALPAALLAAPGTALAGPAFATIHFDGQAVLQPDGSAVVTLVYSCQSLVAGNFGLAVALVQGDSAGTVEPTPVCDGAKHKLAVDVPTVVPFAPGGAVADGEVFLESISNPLASDVVTVKVMT